MGIGATDELSLRVSVAALVRVLFTHPDDGKLMLALERKTTVREEDGQCFVDVKAQPFGGALRIHDMEFLQDLIRDFHFDSEESRAEQDFRIFIRPADWGTIQAFCLEHLAHRNGSVLESDPTRELREEFADATGIDLKPAQYIYQTIGTIVENQPSPTQNIHARGYPTTRIYQIFEARILDPSLASVMLENSEAFSKENLYKLAQNGGTGKTNAILTLPFKEIQEHYQAVPSESGNDPIRFQGQQLDETVAAVLDGVSVAKYRRV